MMKKSQIIIYGIFICLLMLLASLWLKQERKPEAKPDVGKKSEKPLTPEEQDAERKREFYTEREKDWQRHIKKRNVPVEFYGKIIDEKGQPLADTEVKYYIQQPQTMYVDSGLRASITTNEEGRFHVSGVKGTTFGVEKVSKEGYLWVENQEDNFWFSSGHHNVKNHIPDATRPVVYTMIKKEDLPKLIKKNGYLALAWDGIPVRYDIKSGKFSEDGEIIITAWRGPVKGEGIYMKYDWSFKIEILEGGIQQIKSNQTHIVPENNYRKSWQAGELVNNDWVGGIIGSRDLAFRLKDGNYGYLHLKFKPNPRWKKSLTINALLNPIGGRILYKRK